MTNKLTAALEKVAIDLQICDACKYRKGCDDITKPCHRKTMARIAILKRKTNKYEDDSARPKQGLGDI